MSLKVKSYIDSRAGLVSLPYFKWSRRPDNFYWNYSINKSVTPAPNSHFQFIAVPNDNGLANQPTLSRVNVIRGKEPHQVPYDYERDLRHSWPNIFSLRTYMLSLPHEHLSEKDWRKIEKDSNISHLNLGGVLSYLPSELVEAETSYTGDLPSGSLWTWDGQTTPVWQHKYHQLFSRWNWWDEYYPWYGPVASRAFADYIVKDHYGKLHVYDLFRDLLGPDAQGAWFQGNTTNITQMEWDQDQEICTLRYEVAGVWANGFNHAEHSYNYWSATFKSKLEGFTPATGLAHWYTTISESAWQTGWIDFDDNPRLTEDESVWSQVDLSASVQYDNNVTTRFAPLDATEEMHYTEEELYALFHGMANPYWGAMAGSPFPSVFEQAMDALDTVDSKKSESFETVYEFTETVLSMIDLAISAFLFRVDKSDVNSAKHLVDNLLDSLKNIGKRQVRALKDDPVSTVSGWYLQYQFGIAPLMREAQALREAILNEIPNSLTRGYSKLSKTIDIGEYQFNRDINVLVDVSPSMRAFNKASRWLDHFGILPTTERLWAVVPFSFLVDWFLPIGDGLKAFDHAFIRSKLWELRYLVASEKLSKGDIDVPPDFRGTWEVSRYRRYSSLNWPRPGNYAPDMPKLRAGYLPIALALILSATGKPRPKSDQLSQTQKDRLVENQISAAQKARGSK